MARNSQENYELILKVRARFEKMSQGLKFDQVNKKLKRFLNKIKRYISSDLYDILFCIYIRQLGKAM